MEWLNGFGNPEKGVESHLASLEPQLLLTRIPKRELKDLPGTLRVGGIDIRIPKRELKVTLRPTGPVDANQNPEKGVERGVLRWLPRGSS